MQNMRLCARCSAEMERTMNTLTVKDLCKTYIINKRQNNVFKNINMEIREGDMVAVMGL